MLIQMTAQLTPENLPDLSFTQPLHVVAPISYSANLVRGEIIPSRLSSVALHAAAILARDLSFSDVTPKIVTATEQSWSQHPVTTGEALRQHPVADEIDDYFTVLRNDRNRLIHTQLQTDALADLMGRIAFETDLDGMTVTCFNFHRPRVREALDRSGLDQAEVITVDSVINREHEEDPDFADHFKAMHDLSVDWEIVKETGLTEFEEREALTRLVSRYFNGKLIPIISTVLGSGRYDNLTQDGRAIRRRTA